MDYRNKANSGHQPTQPLKLSIFDSQMSHKTLTKSKSPTNLLVKQHLLKDHQNSKPSKNLNNTTLEGYSNLSFQTRNHQANTEQDNEYVKLLNKFNRNKNKYQRIIDSENHIKSNTSSTIKLQAPRFNDTLSSSFRFNDEKLKFPKKGDLKTQSLSKSVSMNFLEALQMKNRKRTPPNRQPSNDKPQPALGSKLNNELVKMLNQIKQKNIIIKQLQNRQQQLIKQLGQRNKFQVQYYKLLNNSILLEQDLRTKDRKIEHLQNEILSSERKIIKLSTENKKFQDQLQNIDLKVSKQSEDQISEWKKINQILSDSLIKLNQQNSLFAKKLSELQSKHNIISNKLSESQKLVIMLKSNIEFQKNAHNSLIQHSKKQSQTLEDSIHSLQKELQQLNLKNKSLSTQNIQKSKSITFFEQESISLIDQIKQLNQTLKQLKTENQRKEDQINKLKQNIQDIENEEISQDKLKEVEIIQPIESQEEELRQQIMYLKISKQQKQAQYEEVIKQYKDKISVLEQQIDEIKCITRLSQSPPNERQTEIESKDNDDQKRQVLKLQTEIVELRSRLQVFAIIEKQLRDRLHLNAERMADLQNQNENKLLSSEAMIATLRKRVQLLQKQLQVVGNIQSKTSDDPQNQDMLNNYIKQLLVKIKNLEDIANNMHIENKKLQHQLKNKVHFVKELKQQIEKDGDIIKQLKNAIQDTNKRLISHSELLEITNKSALNQQIKFGNYRQQMQQQVNELRLQNGSLGGELKGIYSKLETLEQRIDEQDEDQQQQETKAIFGSRIQFTRQRQFYYNTFIEQRKQRLSVLVLQFE